MENKEIFLSLDVSTSCIGYCIYQYDHDTDEGKILKLSHIAPKISSKIKGIETHFLKKRIFENEFLTTLTDLNINSVIIEEPLLRSNNVNTVASLLRFNGMISDSIYRYLNIVPQYISSYDARKFSFPELMSVRKTNKAGNNYEKKKILTSLRKNELVLFGSYAFDIDKKYVMFEKINEKYEGINWIYDKKGELKKENFDASDSLVACLGYINMAKHKEINPIIENIRENVNIIYYDVKIWGKTINKKIDLSD
jgi:hypothetical protein